MTVEFSTTAYQFAHGHSPRGRGYWAFWMGNPSKAANLWFAPGELTYGEAKKQAAAEAKARGVRLLVVAS